MSRTTKVLAFVVLLLGLAGAHSAVRAEEDGPGPVNTTASISAGADDDIVRRHESTPADHGSEHAAGTYMGVAPGATAAPAVAVQAGKNPATITWPGFQMRADGTSRVFIQSTTALDAQPSAATGKYVVHLPGAHVASGTNRLPLETRFFNSPVARVSLNVNREGTDLILELRADVTPQVSSERGPTGYYFLYIDLPKGQFVAPSDKAKAVGQASAKAVPGGKVLAEPDAMTTYLEGDADANVAANARIDNELPPSVKAHSRLSGQIKLGK